MRLGFLILSIKPPDQVFDKLLQFLSSFENSEIFLHHDYHKSDFPEEIINKYKIKLLKPYFETHWSHLNNSLATVAGLKQMYNDTPIIDWFITLTPNCFPIKNHDFIQNFYDSANDDVYIDMHKVKDGTLGELDTYLLRDMQMQPWFKIPFISKRGKFTWKQIRKSVPLADNPFLNGENEYFQGSNYLSLSRKAVEKVVDLKSRINKLNDFYKKYIVAKPNMHPCPQETIIQTFLGNESSVKVCYKSYRFIDWEGSVNWSPNWLNESYFEQLKASEAHWARKLNETQSMTLVKRIENELIEKNI